MTKSKAPWMESRLSLLPPPSEGMTKGDLPPYIGLLFSSGRGTGPPSSRSGPLATSLKSRTKYEPQWLKGKNKTNTCGFSVPQIGCDKLEDVCVWPKIRSPGFNTIF